ncbi:MAG: hypothetical protein ABIM50_11155 [Novosphingobium sp.]
MVYYLFKAVIGSGLKIEISASEYDEIAAAWHSLGPVVDIEEEWDSLIQNYIEFEMELLKAATNSMILSHNSYHDFHQHRLGFARRLSNPLQTCRSYIDHAPHHLGQLNSCDFSSTFNELRNKAHADHFGYRFMDAMRNYAQHRGVPLHSSTWNSDWISDADERKNRLRYVVTANVDLGKVRHDRKFKASVRAEIEGVDRLDVGTMTREYIEALGWVHSELRKAMEGAIAGWKKAIRDAIARYAAATSGGVIGLAAGEFADDGELVNQMSIFEDMLDRHERLTRRNGNLVNLRRRFVSNELLAKKSKQ